MSSASTLLRDAMRLGPTDRRALANALLKSISGAGEELTAEQKKELLRRQAEMKKHPHLGIPWERVRARVCSRRT